MKMFKQLNKKGKLIVMSSLSVLLVCVLILGTLVLNGAFNKVKKQEDEPKAAELIKDYYGILVLGSDQGATNTNGGNHTDSVTYIALNKKTKKAYALPIYRDTIIPVVCDGSEKNINHVYRDNGADCLKESVASILGLPVDYSIYITANGFVDVVNALAPIHVDVEASYCSDYGNDGQTYCFSEGEERDLNGNELLSYARFRGNTSGEMRANRHVQLLNSIYQACNKDLLQCGKVVARAVDTGDVQTDLPFLEAINLDEHIQFENLGVVLGTNFEDANGWHQQMDQTDLDQKVAKIKADIFK